MAKLKMPEKGKSAAMMAELQAEHAAVVPPPEGDELRKAEEPAGTASEAQQRSNVTILQDYNVAGSQLSEATSPPVAPLGAADLSPTPEIRDERYRAALERAAAGDVMVVTVRVSTALNHYVDNYVARMQLVNPSRRYRKQDAVAEAFAAFYADHPMPPLPDDGDL